mmetsp:Transcript_61781/g.172551  ORF Transcript_61781/g.172551 Transcript_61781/m.172551 type:complete len:372 (-) Transcript_61781:263-1378(-)
MPLTQVRMSEALCEEFRENGAVKLEGFLNEQLLEECREKYNWSFDHQSPSTGGFINQSRNTFTQIGTAGTTVEKEVKESFVPWIKGGPFCQAAAQLWGSDKVWYFDHELIAKRRTDFDTSGKVSRTWARWHQDTPVHSNEGEDFCSFWICLDGFVPKESCLAFVKGSHKGIMFDNIFPRERDQVKIPLPLMPDVDKLEEQGDVLPGLGKRVEILSWDLKPGDCIAFHHHTIHGRAFLTEGSEVSLLPFYEDPPKPPVMSLQRRTLVLRFFGERAVYRPLIHPDGGAMGKDGSSVAMQVNGDIGEELVPMPWLDGMKDGEPFWHCAAARHTAYGDFHGFDQVCGAPPTDPAACGSCLAGLLKLLSPVRSSVR